MRRRRLEEEWRRERGRTPKRKIWETQKAYERHRRAKKLIVLNLEMKINPQLRREKRRRNLRRKRQSNQT